MDKKEVKQFDIIIIGAGVAGLFAGATSASPINFKGLLLEQTPTPGNKLLLSGNGKCNLTNTANIKEFISCYGENGKRIRTALYKYNNNHMMDIFKDAGIALIATDGNKVFPKSLYAKEIRDFLVNRCTKNGFQFAFSEMVTEIIKGDIKNKNPNYILKTKTGNIYEAKKIIIATGGLSHPSTGSDGSMNSVFDQLSLKQVKRRPALAPIIVKDYPYAELSGISFPDAKVIIKLNEKKLCQRIEDLLLTHKGFSGPAILHSSRYLYETNDAYLQINYIPSYNTQKLREELFSYFYDMKNTSFESNDTKLPKNSSVRAIYDFFNCKLPRRFIEVVCERRNIAENASNISKSSISALIDILTKDTYKITGTAGYKVAMATAGGISLDEVDLKTFELKKHPGIHIIGEALDVDGDTGGYNIQFAYSSALSAMDVVK